MVVGGGEEEEKGNTPGALRLIQSNVVNEVDAERDACVGDADLRLDQLLAPGGEVQPTPFSSLLVNRTSLSCAQRRC